MRYTAELPERPLAEKDGPNSRLHWAVRRRRTAFWRFAARLRCDQAGFGQASDGDGWVVTITIRAARGVEPDQDNLRGMCKPIVDGIADALGRGDSPRDGIEWRYGWTRGKDAVLIELAQEAGDGA